MRWAAFTLWALLAACGADGEPEPVESKVSVSGEVRIGVTGSF